MPAPPIFGPVDVYEMERLYKTPMTLAAVAEQMHCSVSTVVKYFDDYGIERRSKASRVTESKKRTPEEDQAELMADMYWLEGKSHRAIALELGIHLTTVRVRFKRWRIPTRSAIEARAKVTQTLTEEGRKRLSDNAKRSWREGTHMCQGPEKTRGSKRAA